MSGIPPISPAFKIPPIFNDAPVFDALHRQMECEVRQSREIGALALGREALFFLTAFQPLPGSDYVAEKKTPPKTQIFTWLNRTQRFFHYLDAYLTEVRRDGSPEQVKLLQELLDEPTHEDDAPITCAIDDAEDDSADVAEVVSFPEPSEAITIIERIAQSHASTSVEYVAMQITIRALRYLIESGEAPEFMRYVDQVSKWVPPPDEP